ncbi:MAG: methyltransferase [Flavobacteriaceae bacterium]
MMNNYNWEQRYQDKNTPWTLNQVSPPIKSYFDQKKFKGKILIPGCGMGFEAQYLNELGHEVYILDISNAAIKEFKLKFPGFPEDNIFCQDFFNHELKYDLILEQTFFCALPPELRKNYVEHISALLNKNGRLMGLLFEGTGNEGGPPFKLPKYTYKELFKNDFKIKKIEPCYNSIKPRQGSELFFIFDKI